MSLVTRPVEKIKGSVFDAHTAKFVSTMIPTAIQLRMYESWVIGDSLIVWPRASGKTTMRWFLQMGRELIYGKNGRLKPIANVIYSQAFKRMSTDSPVDIVRDLEAQIKLLVKSV